ncbi:S-layer domain-like protein [Vulcanisaeta moutnovskia 768-28]|uniref:S-layer domain-like protein n=1 Tax=Vulcanisaeta moutnovskia (strain 768-28) TaxID=985053 RepID=F0QU28_VULM7|nr:S-layer protein [Vulcanisaeta moutnovskia]ADY01814.1 S-layer domain-like protein [Vulcanisaeta moutnovskia 768-28]
MDPISLSIIILAHWLLNQPVAPGEDSYLVFTVFNPTQAYLFNMTITINSSLIKPIYYVNSSSNYCQIPVVPPEGNSSCIVYVQVDPNTPMGIYQVPITVNYTEVNITTSIKPLITYQTISIPVTTLVTTTLYNGEPIITGVKTVPVTIQIPTVMGSIPSISTSQTSESVNTNVSVPILGYTGFEATAMIGTPDNVVQALPNSYVPLTIYLTNYGNTPVYNVTVTLLSTPPQINIINTTQHLPALPPGQPVPLTFYAYVPSYISQGNYTLELRVDYFTGVDDVINATLIVPQEPIVYVQSVATNPPEVFQGYPMAQLILSIVNIGSGMAYDAELFINGTGASPLISMPLILGAIPPGQPIQLTVPISLPSNSGNYTMSITVTYDGGSITRYYQLNVRPKANLAIVSISYPQPPNPSLSNLGAMLSTITSPTLSPGASKVPITITIMNEGPVEAKNIMVAISTGQVIQPHVSSSNPLSALTASQAFIGDLKPGQEINVTFLVDVDSNARPGNYPLVLTFVWNQTGSLYPLSESVTTYVTVKPAPNVLLWVVLILIIIVVIIGIIAAIRRRRLGNNNRGFQVNNTNQGSGNYQGRLVYYEVLCGGDDRCVEVELV